jgi:hypothetical protein
MKGICQIDPDPLTQYSNIPLFQSSMAVEYTYPDSWTYLAQRTRKYMLELRNPITLKSLKYAIIVPKLSGKGYWDGYQVSSIVG